MGWTDIADSAFDADSPITEDLLEDIVENVEYEHERALRCGIHATGVRLAMARGKKAFSFSADGSGYGSATATVTFSSDALDGDPNFTSAPVVYMCLEEDDADTAWLVTGGINADEWIAHISDTPSTTGFTAKVAAKSLTASQDYDGFFNWIAIGAVTAGE
jgi:hypothetical protein